MTGRDWADKSWLRDQRPLGPVQFLDAALAVIGGAGFALFVALLLALAS